MGGNGAEVFTRHGKGVPRKSFSEEVTSDQRVNIKKRKSYDKILAKSITMK